MADKLYAVDLGELGTITGTLDQMNNMMRIFNQAGLYAAIKEDEANSEDEEATSTYYHDCWNTSCDAHIKIWDAIKDDYMKEVSDEL